MTITYQRKKEGRVRGKRGWLGLTVTAVLALSLMAGCSSGSSKDAADRAMSAGAVPAAMEDKADTAAKKEAVNTQAAAKARGAESATADAKAASGSAGASGSLGAAGPTPLERADGYDPS